MHAASCGIAAPCNGCFVVDSWMMAEGRPRRVVVRRAQGGDLWMVVIGAMPLHLVGSMTSAFPRYATLRSRTRAA